MKNFGNKTEEDTLEQDEQNIVHDEEEEEVEAAHSQGILHNLRAYTVESMRRKFWPPTREQVWTGIAFWGVILLGALLRFWSLGDRPLHHDESMHAYFSLGLLKNNIQNWASCVKMASDANDPCYKYDPLLHGPFQFHAIALVYQISAWLHAPDNGVNDTTVRIAAATLGSAIVGLPYFLRDRLGTIGAWLACFLLAVSPSMVYFSRFAREDIYMAFFTLLLVVGTARYLRTHRIGWLIVAAIGFALSYATKEATFLTIAIFGSFLGAMLVWELASRWSGQSLKGLPLPTRLRDGKLLILLAYFVVLGIVAKFFFGWLKNLSIYVTTHTHTADVYVQGLKDKTIFVIPFIGIALCLFVFYKMIREAYSSPSDEKRGLTKFINPEKQPLLHTIVTMSWTHWFFAVLIGWTLFVLLFTVMFTNFRTGIQDGIWQGLYYWLQQQQVARGGQPWYYYLMLIPLYEQIGLVFGLVGVVRSLLRPTRFRLFLVYWFVGNLFLYSWAAEKMPWLMIHITMPMLLLAAVGLEPAVVTVVDMLKNWWQATRTRQATAVNAATPLAPARSRVIGAALTVVLAGLLLLPTLQNMREVTYVHAADAPYEMMIYVQTTTDVRTVMAKIDALDQKLYGGKHQLAIGLMPNTTWPFAWYLRDYPNTCFNFTTACGSTNRDIILAAGEELSGAQTQFGGNYAFHQYHMRSQWDQGYMPPRCIVTSTNPCTDPQPYTGVGPWLWLSYGDNPPPGATFNAGLAVQNIWHWWWDRKPFGSTNGTYDMGLFIRKDAGVQP